MIWKLTAFLALGACLAAQTFPLESIDIEGNIRITREAVIRFSGLRIGEPTNKESIEAACGALQATGLFEQISYKYRPGAKRGYAVTLTVSDLGRLMNAAIDLPGIDETEYWGWMKTISPSFDHRVPDSAQDFLAKQIEQHAGPALNGQHMVARLEQDVMTGRSLVAFQPETLPIVTTVGFEGLKEFTPAELTALLKGAMSAGYTDRTFNRYVDINLRPAYENHGMYRVRFAPVASRQESPTSMAVTIPIEEGAKYTLGDVDLVGDNMPREAMLKSAKLPNGQIANWMLIQNGIYQMEKELKRVGYYEALAKPERKLDDSAHSLNLRIAFHTGPVYHYGDVVFKGLNAGVESKARTLWNPPGNVWDLLYTSQFLGEFKKDPALRNWKVKVGERASPQTQLVTAVMEFQAP
jgi:outer membrane protein assembly factor BamA